VVDDAGRHIEAKALVDTGAEVNIVKTGLLSQSNFRESKRPLRLVTASNHRLDGGKDEATVNLQLVGTDMESKDKVNVTAPTVLYEADIGEDIILSYQWLGERGIEVSPRMHGLWAMVAHMRVFIPGERTTPLSRKQSELPWKPLFVQSVKDKAVANEGPWALDLFCGRKSSGDVLRKWGFQVVGLDNDARRNPEICCNILDWDYKSAYPPGHFAIITASPPCTEFSAAKTVGVRDLEGAMKIVERTLEIIEYFKPSIWWLETPRGGLLSRHESMKQ